MDQLEISPSVSGLKIAVFRFVIYGLTIYLLAEFLKWNAGLEKGQGKFSEESLVEYAQSMLLLFSALVFFYTGLKYRSTLVLSVSLFSFTFASFIREQDAVLDDKVFDGAWQTLVFSLLLFTAILIYRKKVLLLSAFNEYGNKFAFGILLSGVLTTYVFARLYGRKVFWMAVMENQYTREVKTVSEESLELLGYVLILIGSIEFLLNSASKSNLTDLDKTPPNAAKVVQAI